mmetsp:Transcript_5906/g.5147  ORF Transcript_5906/g.5147 Transcript_5906/m.5147 type:complete len:150 (+) Transcript_5906:844-1293(+)
MDDPRLEGYNLDVKGDQFAAWFRTMSNSYNSDVLLHTAGEDFNYQDANVNFKNMKKIMDYVNNNQGKYNMHIDYSTPDKYVDEINGLGKTYPFKYDDFFPYADDEDSYWTGYFTSRVGTKGYVRKTGRFTQAVKKLVTQDLWYGTSQFI